jgi:Tfp pilus assembly protein PilO
MIKLKLTNRELILACSTLTVILGGVTFLLGEAKLASWKQLSSEKTALRAQIQNDQLILSRKDSIATQLDELHKQLPRFETKRQVAPELLNGVRDIADRNQLKLSRIQPGKEQQTGDLNELRIACQWTGTLETLTRTLVALQESGARYDISKMYITPVSAGNLKGSMDITCAYYRNDEPIQE